MSSKQYISEANISESTYFRAWISFGDKYIFKRTISKSLSEYIFLRHIYFRESGDVLKSICISENISENISDR